MLGTVVTVCCRDAERPSPPLDTPRGGLLVMFLPAWPVWLNDRCDSLIQLSMVSTRPGGRHLVGNMLQQYLPERERERKKEGDRDLLLTLTYACRPSLSLFLSLSVSLSAVVLYIVS